MLSILISAFEWRRVIDFNIHEMEIAENQIRPHLKRWYSLSQSIVIFTLHLRLIQLIAGLVHIATTAICQTICRVFLRPLLLSVFGYFFFRLKTSFGLVAYSPSSRGIARSFAATDSTVTMLQAFGPGTRLILLCSGTIKTPSTGHPVYRRRYVSCARTGECSLIPTFFYWVTCLRQNRMLRDFGILRICYIVCIL